jgi:hypothetical protein
LNTARYSCVSWWAIEIITESSCCFWKWNQNLGCRFCSRCRVGYIDCGLKFLCAGCCIRIYNCCCEMMKSWSGVMGASSQCYSCWRWPITRLWSTPLSLRSISESVGDVGCRLLQTPLVPPALHHWHPFVVSLLFCPLSKALLAAAVISGPIICVGFFEVVRLMLHVVSYCYE